MSLRNMKFRPRAAGALIALTLSAAALSGCVYYPSYGYGGYGGYGYGYEAPPVVVAPGPFIFGGYGGGWRGGYGRGGWR